jgi:hypothetical protein
MVSSVLRTNSTIAIPIEARHRFFGEIVDGFFMTNLIIEELAQRKSASTLKGVDILAIEPL